MEWGQSGDFVRHWEEDSKTNQGAKYSAEVGRKIFNLITHIFFHAITTTVSFLFNAYITWQTNDRNGEEKNQLQDYQSGKLEWSKVNKEEIIKIFH